MIIDSTRLRRQDAAAAALNNEELSNSDCSDDNEELIYRQPQTNKSRIVINN